MNDYTLTITKTPSTEVKKEEEKKIQHVSTFYACACVDVGSALHISIIFYTDTTYTLEPVCCIVMDRYWMLKDARLMRTIVSFASLKLDRVTTGTVVLLAGWHTMKISFHSFLCMRIIIYNLKHIESSRFFFRLHRTHTHTQGKNKTFQIFEK